MFRHWKRHIGLMLVMVVLTGCGATWKRLNKEGQRWKKGKLETVLPVDWYRDNVSREVDLVLSKDGPALQNIRINLMSSKTELPHTEQKMNKDMMPHELANLIIDEMMLNDHYQNFKLLKNSPIQLDSVDAYHLNFEYNTPGGPTYKVIEYGFILGKKYYEVRYQAVKTHYFEGSLPDFEFLVSQIKIL